MSDTPLSSQACSDPPLTGLQAIGTLKEIRMNNNGIYEEGIVAISRAVAFNPKLEVRQRALCPH
jgi:Ran GTPase-activating protein (RanGAP) involved in mRNA processing and transport